MAFRSSTFLPFSLVILLIILGTACNRNQPSSESESEPKSPTIRETQRSDVAIRIRSAVKRAGGGEIWIKRNAKFQQGRGSETTMRVVATSAGYHAVLAALRQQAKTNGLTLSRGEALRDGHRITVFHLNRKSQPVFRMELREVPRLMRASIVIDDMGADLQAAHRLLDLDYPLTFSVLPYLRYSRETAEDAHHDGREVMLHLPMEPEGRGHVSPGEGAILVGMNKKEVQTIVQKDLAAVPFVAGVNNHMGSRATQDAALMSDVMTVLADRRLYFIDSRTTPTSAALAEARKQHLPAFYRGVFLDNTESVDYTLGQLREFEERVEERGIALAIGHPHATTITALAKFLPELDSADIELIPPSQITRLPELDKLEP